MKEKNLHDISLDELKKLLLKEFIVNISIDYDGSCTGLEGDFDEQYQKIEDEISARNIAAETVRGWLVEAANGIMSPKTRQNTAAELKRITINAPLTTDRNPFQQPAIEDKTTM